jgi:hypothetical protein
MDRSKVRSSSARPVEEEHMALSRQVRAAIGQALTALTVSAARTLLYKHLGVRVDASDTSSIRYLQAVSSAEDDEVRALADELVIQQESVRADAPTKHVFDLRIADLERWLLHDGWLADGGALVRVTPAAEDVTGIRDKLSEDLAASGLDADGSIVRSLEEASEAFVAAAPDYNGSITKVRIALESTGSSRRNRGGCEVRCPVS